MKTNIAFWRRILIYYLFRHNSFRSTRPGLSSWRWVRASGLSTIVAVGLCAELYRYISRLYMVEFTLYYSKPLVARVSMWGRPRLDSCWSGGQGMRVSVQPNGLVFPRMTAKTSWGPLEAGQIYLSDMIKIHYQLGRLCSMWWFPEQWESYIVSARWLWLWLLRRIYNTHRARCVILLTSLIKADGDPWRLWQISPIAIIQ